MLEVTINPVDADRLPLGSLLPYEISEHPSIEPGTIRVKANRTALNIPASVLTDYADVNPRGLILALCERGSFEPFFCHEWRAGFKKAEHRDRL